MVWMESLIIVNEGKLDNVVNSIQVDNKANFVLVDKIHYDYKEDFWDIWNKSYKMIDL